MKALRFLKFNSFIICFLVLFLLFGAIEVSADYFVSTIGSDSNPGTEASPFKTIQHAANVAVAGDTVIVKDGTYTDTDDDGAIFKTVNGGTSGNWITFKAENKWGAVLDGENRTSTYSIVFQSGDHYIRIENFDITEGVRGIMINGANHDITIINNKIHDLGVLETSTASGQSGIFCGASTSDITIDSNYFYEIGRNGTYTNHDHGIYLGGNPAVRDVLIKNNIFVNRSSGWPIQIYNASGTFANITITNNIFHKQNTTRDGHILVAARIDNLLIQNNIMLDPRGTAIRNKSCTGKTNITIRNNITDVANIIGSESCSFTYSNNQTSTDPLLTDPDNFDYTLQSTSPAIDAGISTSAPAVDYIGTPRPQGLGCDIGAYEYVTLTESSPKAPTGMKIP